MSNYLSAPYETNKPPQDENFQLLYKTMEMRQGKYDANKAKAEQTLAYYGEKLKGLRGEDNEYIAAKLNDLSSTIKEAGDLSLSSNSDNIMSRIGAVAKDPIVESAVVNRVKFDNLNKEYAERVKKGDGSANEINYLDALKQGGYEDYMNGKTNSLGNLSYKSYIDVPKVVNELTSEWATKHGYKTVFDSKNGGYYFQNTEREVLTKDEILNFIGSVVDPSMQSQIEINARATFGNMKDADYNQYFTQRYTQENEMDVMELAKQQALQKSVSGQEAEIVQSNINILESRIGERKQKIANGTFDKSEQYSAYRKDLFSKIASNYERDNIVDIEYDTTPLEIAKFELDKTYKAEDIRIKQETLQLEKTAATQANMPAGTALPEVSDSDEETKEDDFTQIRTSFIDTQSQLRAALERDDPAYRAKESKEAKDAYLLQIIKSGGKINPNSQEPLSISVVNAVNNHKSNYEAYVGYKKGVYKEMDVSIVDAYEDLRQGIKNKSDLNVDNLAITMPNFAKALKSGKEFSKLTEEEKDLARYEFTSNALKYGTGNEPREKELYEMYLQSLNTRNRKNPQFKTKTTEADQKVGFLSGIKDAVSSPLKTTLSLVSAVAGGAWQSVFQGREAGKKAFNSNFADAAMSIGESLTGGGQLVRVARDITPFGGQDTNITELEGRDTSSGTDVWDKFKGKIRASVDSQNLAIKPYTKNIPAKTSYSFSTEDKSQEGVAEVLRQVVIKNGGVLPSDGSNNYDLSYNARTKQYSVSYISKVEQSKIKTPLVVDEALMPKVIRDSMNTSQENWNTSKNNSKAKLPVFVYSPPFSESQTARTIENFNKIAPNTFSEQEQYKMTYNPLFLPPQARYEAISELYPIIKENQEMQEQLNSLINSTIEVVPVVSPGVGFFADVYKVQGNKRVKLNKGNDVPLGETYDPQDFLRKQLMIVGDYTNKEIEKIIR